MIITIPEDLSARSLQLAFEATGFASLDSWIQSAEPDDRLLHIDLSRVEFAEFTAAARILLMTDAAARSGVVVRVDLPSSGTARYLTPGLVPLETGMRKAAPATTISARRARCLRFLRATGFTTAIRLPHIPEANVEVGGQQQSDPLVTVSAEPGDQVGGRRQILPFRWFPRLTGDALFRSEHLISIIRGLMEIGLSNRDSQRLGNAVFLELIENVAIHGVDDRKSSQPYALVGALAMDTGLHRGPESVRPELTEFNDWVKDTGTSVLQIVVGDSGAGLVASLSSSVVGRAVEPASDERTSEWSAAEQIALRSLDRWSTSFTEPQPTTRGTRGLWRTLRTVRSYGGALFVHTAEASVGHLISAPDTRPVRADSVSGTPGTLIEALVLPEGIDVAGVVAAPPATGGSVDLQWVRFSEDASSDATLFARADEIVQMQHNVLMTVDGGRTHHLTHERLVAILAKAADLAMFSAVVVLVTGVDPEDVDTGVDALHYPLPPGDAANNTGAPFLLIDSTGRTQWCGGSEQTRARLVRLADAPESAGDPPSDLSELLTGHPQVVRSVGDLIYPAIQPSDVNLHLEQLASSALKDAISIGNENTGVLGGRFRTPSLKLTNRWVNVDLLLARTTGTGVIAYLLAQRLAARVPKAADQKTWVVQISPLVRDLSQMLAESAGLWRDVYQMTDLFGAVEPEEPPPAGTSVVVCGDILLTQNDAKNKLRELLGFGAIPLAIVVPLDARGQAGPIEVEGLSIPVISLAEVSSGSIDPEDGPIIDIDPVFRAPVASSTPSPSHRWTEEEFLRASVELPGIAGLGHVRRQLRRHFTVYFDAGRVVDSASEVRKLISAQALEIISAWLGETAESADGSRIKICYVGLHSDYAGRLAGLVATQLSERLALPQSLSLVQVPRAVVAFRYAFPEVLDRSTLPRESDVILIDWGSFDSTTVLQLMRLAAEGGARRILGVILLSQMGRHDERALTMVRSVTDAAGNREIPTRIEFLTSLGVTPAQSADCSLCRLAAEIRAESRRGGMPREVAAHAKQLADSLKARTREEVVRSGVDAFGSPSTSEDAIEYIIVRSQFLAGLRSTERSAVIVERLHALATMSEESRAHAVVRLLAAERHWLTLPPGRLIASIASISRIATAMAVDKRLDDKLRMEALIVLGAAEPEVLVERLPEFWLSALDRDEVLLHLLYQIWVILRRHSHRPSTILGPFRESVGQCLSIGIDAYSSIERAEEMKHSLTRLAYTIDRQSEHYGVFTAQAAWVRLHEYYIHSLDRHSEAEAAAISLLVYMEDLPTGSEFAEDAWKTVTRTWDSIAAFLQDHVLPFTPPLADILNGAFAEEHLTYARRLRLSRLASAEAVEDLEFLGSRFYQLQGGTPTDAAFINTWQGCAADLDQWYNSVLNAGGLGLRRAELAAFLDACPTSLMKVLEEGRALAHRQQLQVQIDLLPNGHEHVQVFCHRDLLRSAVQHVVGNAVKLSHRLPEFHDSNVSLAIEVHVYGQRVHVSFRNTGTAATRTTGRGIMLMRRKLADFEADLEPIEPAPGYTFEVELRLALWRSTETEEVSA